MKLKPTQFAIYEFLKKHEGETLLHSDFLEFLDMSKPTLSQTINELIKLNLIAKNGKKYKILA